MNAVVPLPSPVPIIYTRILPPERLRWWGRGIAALTAMVCLTVMLIAAWLRPDAHGVGTHTQLGLQPCQFRQSFGLPCPSCGFTTSFALLAHGRPIESLCNQPMGALLAVLTIATSWVGLYVALTGRPVHRLLRFVPGRYYLWPLLSWGLLAWGWKIVLTLRGWDGWAP